MTFEEIMGDALTSTTALIAYACFALLYTTAIVGRVPFRDWCKALLLLPVRMFRLRRLRSQSAVKLSKIAPVCVPAEWWRQLDRAYQTALLEYVEQLDLTLLAILRNSCQPRAPVYGTTGPVAEAIYLSGSPLGPDWGAIVTVPESARRRAPKDALFDLLASSYLLLLGNLMPIHIAEELLRTATLRVDASGIAGAIPSDYVVAPGPKGIN